jgi:hypothetical protein
MLLKVLGYYVGVKIARKLAATTPTEFYTTFLGKKSQFKAKDMIVHKLQSEKIAFNPNSSFINSLWNCEFFWLLPDTPSGISIFFCHETKSSNANEIENERLLALADKVNISDIEKLTKQKLYLPNNLMDLVWMTQNFYTVVKLCFGDCCHSAQFLKEWADHMYSNRIMYSTIQASDPFFFAKVLFAIDSALQVHLRSCSSATIVCYKCPTFKNPFFGCLLNKPYPSLSSIKSQIT